jgi:hypothetical protein
MSSIFIREGLLVRRCIHGRQLICINRSGADGRHARATPLVIEDQRPQARTITGTANATIERGIARNFRCSG